MMAADPCLEPSGPFTADPQHQCSGQIDSPICYVVPPSQNALPGFLRIVFNPDCTAASTTILDSGLVAVPGAVQAACDPLATPDCCDTASLCSILQGLPTQVPGVADTALFVTLAGCFRGVPGGGGGGFPGYGAPVTTACANAAGVSLLVARADHVHRSEIPVQDEGAAVGSRCSINFIGAGVAAVDNPGLDRVDVTIAGTVFPLLAPDGSCLAPSYSFASSPDSGMFYTGTAVRIGDDNCADFIEVGASVNITSSTGTVTTTATAGSIVDVAGAAWTATATGSASLTGASLALASTATTISVAAATSFEILTSATSRLLINSLGAWNVNGGGFGVAGQAILSGGPGVPPAWTTVTPAGIGANQTVTVQDAGAVEVVNPSTINFNDGFVVTPAGALATVDLDYGVPVATAQANAAGAGITVARSDHVHRTIVQVLDTGALTSSRPSVNFIDGTGIAVTVVDNGGADRADITIASTTGMTGFATPTVAADAAAATGGVATTAIRSDAKLQVATGVPVATAQANAAGVATTLARSDHVHRTIVQVQEEGVLAGSRPTINFVGGTITALDDPGGDRVNITVVSIPATITTQENGVTLSTTVNTLDFNNGIIASGAGATTTLNLDYGVPSANGVDASAPTAGASNQVLRADAKFQALTGVPVTIGLANTAGVAASLVRSDHVHRGAVPQASNSVLIATEPGINLIPGTGVGIVAVDDPGNNRVNFTISDTSGVTGFATPTVAADAAAATGGAATTAIRSDAKLQVSTAAPPANSVDAGAPTAGVAATLLRSDAKLQAATAAPVATAQANAAGVATTLARSDHVHRTIVQVLDTAVLVSSRPSVNFIDGTGITVTVADDAGNDRANITIASSTGVTGFATPTVAADAAAATGGAATTAIRSDAKLQVSTAAPTVTVKSEATAASAGAAATLLRTDAQIQAQTAAPSVNVLSDASTFSQGASSSLLRADCRFIATTAVPVAIGTANAQGVATSLARSDHVHASNGPAFIQRFTFQADQFDSPVNANWAINALAPAAADSTNAALVVRRFDDTIEEGVGGLLTVPPNAVNVNFLFKWRAQTAPGAAVGVVLSYYTRSIPNNAAVGAWSAAVNFTTLAVPTNANFQYSSQTITLATLGWTVATLRQFEITRRGTQAADTLVGDFDLVELIIEFTT